MANGHAMADLDAVKHVDVAANRDGQHSNKHTSAHGDLHLHVDAAAFTDQHPGGGPAERDAGSSTNEYRTAAAHADARSP